MGDFQNQKVSQPGQALPSPASPKRREPETLRDTPRGEGKSQSFPFITPSIFRAQGTFLYHFFSHWHEGQMKRIPHSLLQRQRSALASQSLILFAIFTCFPSSCLRIQVPFLLLGSEFFLFAVAHRCPIPHVSELHPPCHFFSSVLSSLPIFLIPVFSFSSVSNLFSPSHFCLSNPFLLSSWGRF